jgi:hypothetical protein
MASWGFAMPEAPLPSPPKRKKPPDWNIIKNLCFISGLELNLAKCSKGCSPLFPTSHFFYKGCFGQKFAIFWEMLKKGTFCDKFLVLKIKTPKKKK